MRCALLAVMFIPVVACAAPPNTLVNQQSSSAAQNPTAPKRLVISVISEPTGFNLAVETARLSITQAGLAYFLFPGLTVKDHQGLLHPTLGEALPSVENGLWKVLPDGRMETTYPIRTGAQWHDGTPLTGDDLAFTIAVISDKGLAEFSQQGVNLIEKVDPSPRSVTVSWKQPFIDADSLFSMTGNNSHSNPLPQHILQQDYLNNKAGFSQLPYWQQDFIGLGPYRLKDWVRGSYLTLGAFDGYALGRPKIDEISVLFIPDSNTMIANLISGALDMPEGSVVGVDQALAIKEQWQNGQVIMETDGWVVAYAQGVDPQPAIVSNVQFRKALMYATDRQQMADTLMYGLQPVADGLFSPKTPEYEATQAGIVRYEYNPQRALQMLQELGFTRGSDGLLRDTSGKTLDMEVRSYAQRDIHHKTLFPLVDYWKQIGINAEPSARTADQGRDAKEMAEFPSFLVLRQPNDLARLVALHSSQARTAQRNYGGTNNGRYQNPEIDNLIERFQQTIPMTERMPVAAQIVHLMSDQLPILSLFYDALPAFINNRVTNIHPSSYFAWNVHEWDLK